MEQINTETNVDLVSAKIIPLFKDAPFEKKDVLVANDSTIENETSHKEIVVNVIYYVCLSLSFFLSTFVGLGILGSFSITMIIFSLFEGNKPKKFFSYSVVFSILAMVIELGLIITKYYITSTYLNYSHGIIYALLMMPMVSLYNNKKSIISCGMIASFWFCFCTIINIQVAFNPLDNALAQYYLPAKNNISLEDLPKKADALFDAAENYKIYRETRLARAQLAIKED
jgi:hypothetical protein